MVCDCGTPWAFLLPFDDRTYTDWAENRTMGGLSFTYIFLYLNSLQALNLDLILNQHYVPAGLPNLSHCIVLMISDEEK